MQAQETSAEPVTARLSCGPEGTEAKGRAEEPDRVHRDPDEFAFIVSHDLKEPLGGIRAYCEILLEDYQDKLDSEGRRRLNGMVEMCDRMAASINSLLDCYRVEHVHRSHAKVDLGAVVEDVLQTFRPIIDSRRASVQVVHRLPTVQGDAALIARVFSNLVSNGLKFTRSDAPQVEIGAVEGDPPVIYVRDNGIGIPRKYHEEIFTVFRRLHSRREYEGSGAGLTIVRKIVELHGGRVWLESEPGQGTTFFFTLGPASAEAAGAKEPSKPPHWIGRPGRRPTRGAGKRQERV